MKTIQPPPFPSADVSSAAVPTPFRPAFDAGAAHAFDQVMSGFGAAAAPAVQAPSMLSQMVRLPSQAYAEGMADIQRPRPEGMNVLDSLDFYAHKQITLNELKTLNNMSTTVVRTVRKDLEAVLNSK